MEKQIACAIDIGTTKVYAIIAEIDKINKTVQVLGYGHAQSSGLNKGKFVNLEQIEKEIRIAIKRAEIKANLEVENVYVGISGKHIKSKLSTVEYIISEEEAKIITQSDYNALLEKACHGIVTPDEEVLNKIVYNCKIDGYGLVKNPVGMTGKSIVADVHIITAEKHQVDALRYIFNDMGVTLEKVILEPLASAKSVLKQKETKAGVALVDIGGGTTDIAIFRGDKLIFSNVIEIGGNNFTVDTTYGLNIHKNLAEKVKKIYDYNLDPKEHELVIPRSNGEEEIIDIGLLKEIISSRLDDLFDQIKITLEQSGFEEYISKGVIFTGGASQISSLEELAKSKLDFPIELRKPKKHDGFTDEMLTPEHATGIGIMLIAAEQIINDKIIEFMPNEEIEEYVEEYEEVNEKSAIDNIKDFFAQLF